MKNNNSNSVFALILTLILSISLSTTSTAEPVEIELGYFGGRPTVQVMLGEAGPFTFVLDTGAGGVVLDEAILDQIDLTSIGKQLVGSPGGEQFEVDRYSIDTLMIGDFELFDQNAVALDLQGLRATSPTDVHSVISFWLLVESYSVLDLAAGTLTIDNEKNLSAQDEGVFDFVNQPPFPYPQFMVEISELEILAHFDTGSPDSLTTALGNADNL